MSSVEYCVTYLDADGGRREGLQVLRVEQMVRVRGQHLHYFNGETLRLTDRIRGL